MSQSLWVTGWISRHVPPRALYKETVLSWCSWINLVRPIVCFKHSQCAFTSNCRNQWIFYLCHVPYAQYGSCVISLEQTINSGKHDELEGVQNSCMNIQLDHLPDNETSYCTSIHIQNWENPITHSQGNERWKQIPQQELRLWTLYPIYFVYSLSTRKNSDSLTIPLSI